MHPRHGFRALGIRQAEIEQHQIEGFLGQALQCRGQAGGVRQLEGPGRRLFQRLAQQAHV